LRAAYGWGSEQDWSEAIAQLEQAAIVGEEGASRQLALVTQMPIEDLLKPPVPEPLSPKARVSIARGFAPPGFGDFLMERAESRLKRATTAGGKIDHQRTAWTSFTKPIDGDIVLAVMQHRAAALMGVPVENHEAPSVIRYRKGQEYVAHYDYLDPAVERERNEIARFGQRIGTVVTYLNHGFEGAPTVFPLLGFGIKGDAGDAIFFANVLPDGNPDKLTLHRAPPPKWGEKWVLSQWIRSKRLTLADELLPA
jgi:prolyl 4-hydroxylase